MPENHPNLPNERVYNQSANDVFVCTDEVIKTLEIIDNMVLTVVVPFISYF